MSTTSVLLLGMLIAIILCVLVCFSDSTRAVSTVLFIVPATVAVVVGTIVYFRRKSVPLANRLIGLGTAFAIVHIAIMFLYKLAAPETINLVIASGTVAAAIGAMIYMHQQSAIFAKQNEILDEQSKSQLLQIRFDVYKAVMKFFDQAEKNPTGVYVDVKNEFLDQKEKSFYLFGGEIYHLIGQTIKYSKAFNEFWINREGKPRNLLPVVYAPDKYKEWMAAQRINLELLFRPFLFSAHIARSTPNDLVQRRHILEKRILNFDLDKFSTKAGGIRELEQIQIESTGIIGEFSVLVLRHMLDRGKRLVALNDALSSSNTTQEEYGRFVKEQSELINEIVNFHPET